MGNPKKGRRARGTGTIFRSEAHDCWIGRATVGGRRREVRAPTQREVIARLAALRPPGPGVTVGEWAARWLSSVDVRPGTLADYEIAVRVHITPRIGAVRLDRLTAHEVESFATQLLRAGRKPGTVSKVVGTLRTCLSAAVRAGLIAASPAAVARRPKRPKTRVDPMSPADLARVIADAGRYSCGGAIALCAATGCRVGEAVGLDVSDWDAAAGTVSITKTFNGRTGVGPPKSPHSIRTIEVPAPARPHLEEAARGAKPKWPLFRTSSGRRFWPEEVLGSLKRLLRRLGLPERNTHQLRHTLASHLAARGMAPAKLAEYLGDTVGTVVRVYLHPTGEGPRRMIEELLGGDGS